jgi:hypothetical protein
MKVKKIINSFKIFQIQNKKINNYSYALNISSQQALFVKIKNAYRLNLSVKNVLMKIMNHILIN